MNTVQVDKAASYCFFNSSKKTKLNNEQHVCNPRCTYPFLEQKYYVIFETILVLEQFEFNWLAY